METSFTLPAVLLFHGKQNSISLERALKNAIKVIEQQAQPTTSQDMDELEAALGDLELMKGAIQR